MEMQDNVSFLGYILVFLCIWHNFWVWICIISSDIINYIIIDGISGDDVSALRSVPKVYPHLKMKLIEILKTHYLTDQTM